MAQCWRENPAERPTFDQIAAVFEKEAGGFKADAAATCAAAAAQAAEEVQCCGSGWEDADADEQAEGPIKISGAVLVV